MYRPWIRTDRRVLPETSHASGVSNRSRPACSPSPPKRALRPRGFALIWVLIRAVQCGEFGSEHVFLKLVATFAIAVASLGSALAPVVATERPLKIVALGDSLTAGYGLPATDAFPVKLAHALEAKGIKVQIVNAGVSGDTTAGGLARLRVVAAERHRCGDSRTRGQRCDARHRSEDHPGCARRDSRPAQGTWRRGSALRHVCAAQHGR